MTVQPSTIPVGACTLLQAIYIGSRCCKINSPWPTPFQKRYKGFITLEYTSKILTINLKTYNRIEI